MGVFAAGSVRAPVCANDNETTASFLLDIRGQAAALAGCQLAANPYIAGSYEAARWSVGWLAGGRHLLGDAVLQPAPERLRGAVETLAV